MLDLLNKDALTRMLFETDSCCAEYDRGLTSEFVEQAEIVLLIHVASPDLMTKKIASLNVASPSLGHASAIYGMNCWKMLSKS